MVKNYRQLKSLKNDMIAKIKYIWS